MTKIKIFGAITVILLSITGCAPTGGERLKAAFESSVKAIFDSALKFHMAKFRKALDIEIPRIEAKCSVDEMNMLAEHLECTTKETLNNPIVLSDKHEDLEEKNKLQEEINNKCGPEDRAELISWMKTNKGVSEECTKAFNAIKLPK